MSEQIDKAKPGIIEEHRLHDTDTGSPEVQIDRGVDPAEASSDEVEAALYAPDALVLELTPHERAHDTEDLRRPPRYRWEMENP